MEWDSQNYTDVYFVPLRDTDVGIVLDMNHTRSSGVTVSSGSY
jgi:hypothetical protein